MVLKSEVVQGEEGGLEREATLEFSRVVEVPGRPTTTRTGFRSGLSSDWGQADQVGYQLDRLKRERERERVSLRRDVVCSSCRARLGRSLAQGDVDQHSAQTLPIGSHQQRGSSGRFARPSASSEAVDAWRDQIWRAGQGAGTCESARLSTCPRFRSASAISCLPNTMLDSTKKRLRNHSRTLALTVGVAGGLYLAGSYAIERLRDVQEQAGEERRARERSV